MYKYIHNSMRSSRTCELNTRSYRGWPHTHTHTRTHTHMHSCVCTYLQAERERIENSELQRLAKVAPLTAMCDQVLDSDQPASDLAEEQVSI